MSNFGEMLHPVARKDHVCIMCFGPIPKGEVHVHYKGMWDGEWQDWRAHDECDSAFQDEPYSYEDGFTPGGAEMPERVKVLRDQNRAWQKVYFIGKKQNPVFKAVP